VLSPGASSAHCFYCTYITRPDAINTCQIHRLYIACIEPKFRSLMLYIGRASSCTLSSLLSHDFALNTGTSFSSRNCTASSTSANPTYGSKYCCTASNRSDFTTLSSNSEHKSSNTDRKSGRMCLEIWCVALCSSFFIWLCAIPDNSLTCSM
jgi:hypothetical protein